MAALGWIVAIGFIVLVFAVVAHYTKPEKNADA